MVRPPNLFDWQHEDAGNQNRQDDVVRYVDVQLPVFAEVVGDKF